MGFSWISTLPLDVVPRSTLEYTWKADSRSNTQPPGGSSLGANGRLARRRAGDGQPFRVAIRETGRRQTPFRAQCSAHSRVSVGGYSFPPRFPSRGSLRASIDSRTPTDTAANGPRNTRPRASGRPDAPYIHWRGRRIASGRGQRCHHLCKGHWANQTQRPF